MKTFIITACVFITLSAHAQQKFTGLDIPAASSYTGIPQFKTAYFKSHTCNNNTENAVAVIHTFRQKDRPAKGFSFMRREAIPSDLNTVLSPEEMEGSANVYATKSHIGSIKFSCDYFYDDAGRLIVAEPCWQFGK